MIDVTKYGGEPIEETKDKFYGKIDVEKYGGTPATVKSTISTKIGEKGMGGFATGFTKSLLGGAVGTARLLQGAGQRIIAGATGQKYADVKAKTGFTSLKEGSEEAKAIDEILKRRGSAEKTGAFAEQVAEVFLPGMLVKKAIKIANTTKYLKNTPKTLTSFEEKTASLEGRIKTSLGKKIILPSTTEKRAATLLKGKISSNVTKNPLIIQKEIAKRGQEVENFLVKNAKPVTAQEQANMFNIARKSMEKYATKTELKAYDEQMKTFTKHIVGKGGFTTDNFYKALKEFETNVTSNLSKGKVALIGDSSGIGSARIRAAQDVRKVVRDMIGQKHPEFKGKMFDLASLYDVLDTAFAKSRQFDISKTRKFIGNVAKYGGGGAILYGVGKKLLSGGSGGQSLSSINTIGNE